MAALSANLAPVLILFALTAALHVLERKMSLKWPFAVLNIALHAGVILYFLSIGASIDAILFFLMLSLVVAIA